MKNSFLSVALILLGAAAAFPDSEGFSGGSFSASVQGAQELLTVDGVGQISFSGYGYASLTESLFIGGFGEGFGGEDITSGYGGLALGLWLHHGDKDVYLLNFLGIGLLGYRDVPYLGMVEELSINYGVFLSERFLFSLYLGVNVQSNLSYGAFTRYLSVAPIFGGRIDFGAYKNIVRS